MVIDAPSEVCIAGRATGKTTGILAPKTALKYADTMPRGTHVIISATFTQAYTRTLKELIRGWEKIGYRMDHHFLVGTKPSEKWKKKWKWQGPYAPPLDYKYFISWWNGAVFQLISQERVGGSNGISIDSISGDEAKLLNEERFNTELLPANRGIIKAFENNPYHHGITLTTDMPVGTAGRWLLDKFNAMDREVIKQIWQLQIAKFQLKYGDLPDDMSEAQKEEIKKLIEKQIAVIDSELLALRKGLLYYHEATTIDNIHALGIDYIKQQIRDSTKFQFDTQILNIRPLRLEDGFYPDFDEQYHGYFKESESYFDNKIIDPLDPVFDCRKDADCDTNAPLHLAGDYNRRIHPFVVAQVTPAEIRILKGIHALYPDKLEEALQQFIAYYKPHKKKVIYYWHDHTTVGGMTKTAIWEDVVAALKKAGWVVIPRYIGQAAEHEEKYRMYGHLLKEDGKYKKVLRLNRENCDKLILSVGMAGAEQKKDGFGKDKKTEKDPKFPAEESTHYSDALDTLVVGVLESGLDYKTGGKGYDMIITR